MTPDATTADRLLIHDLLVRYCRGIDRGDEVLIRSCYWDNSFDDHGSWSGPGVEFAAYVVPRLARFVATQHRLSNSSVTLVDGHADAETYVEAHHLRPPDADGIVKVFVFAGRYIDRLERRNGEWRIAHRVVVCDWTRVDVIADDEAGGVDEGWRAQFARGRRDLADPSYRDVPTPAPGATR